MYEEYAFPVMIISYCRNTEENGNWCKSQNETDAWLAKHVSYFVAQETRIQTDIWDDNEEIINGHPYFGDKSVYFPTMKLMKEVQFETIKVDPAYKEDEIMGDELWFGLSTVEINDNNLFAEYRSGDFVNMVHEVDFTNSRYAYNYDETEIIAEDVIFIRNLMTTNEGHFYSRLVTPFVDEISAVGGLFYPLLFIGFILSFLIVDPFRSLNMAIAFSKVKKNICQQEGLVPPDS